MKKVNTTSSLSPVTPLSGQSNLPRPPSGCDKLECYYNCRLSLAGGGECGRAGGPCRCYQRDGLQRRADNIWYELSHLQQQQITAAEKENNHSELGSGGGEEEDNYYDQEYQEDDDDDSGDEGGESWWSG